ncbi:helix-turn-helix domain-containing protein [Microbispora cellulosiformans]|uniref:Helix-turn-helix domain-containing protein n=1 Tax=Microbispora cellulosiformans TaxID=2614688 RepID=A0A5J5JWB8_9ACTN|nr:helix-turn-helix transcriptional regulator [Microbispora cellulosiformans]KAA9374194.1 helix-turn-helix domain-containing protein [Microbispora cellulosiformans]
MNAQADNAASLPLGLARSGPTALRLVLGAQLRRLRRESGITPETAAHTIRASHAKISRLELGRVGFKERDVADLLTLYGLTDPDERTVLLDLARQANVPGWWHKYSDVLPGWFEFYVGLEEAACIIRCYELQFVPSLLQTPEYARATVQVANAARPADEIDRHVDLRLRRQKRLTGPDSATLWAVVDEGVLRRPVGGPAVMRAQLEHLLEVTGRSKVTLQVVPFDRGGKFTVGGPFTILRFDAPELPDVVYTEQLTSAIYLDKAEDTEAYTQVLNAICVEAYSAERTTAFLKELLADYR